MTEKKNKRIRSICVPIKKNMPSEFMFDFIEYFSDFFFPFYGSRFIHAFHIYGRVVKMKKKEEKLVY